MQRTDVSRLRAGVARVAGRTAGSYVTRPPPRYARTVARLRDSIATPAGKAPHVRRLFATIADRYDLITVWLSYGQDRRWKRRLLGSAGPLRGRRVLDLACGTGDIAWLAAARG